MVGVGIGAERNRLAAVVAAAEVRAKADGFVVQLLDEPNASVEAGDPLILTSDPAREAQVALLEAELRELKARYHSERGGDLVRSRITLDEIRSQAQEES